MKGIKGLLLSVNALLIIMILFLGSCKNRFIPEKYFDREDRLTQHTYIVDSVEIASPIYVYSKVLGCSFVLSKSDFTSINDKLESMNHEVLNESENIFNIGTIPFYFFLDDLRAIENFKYDSSWGNCLIEEVNIYDSKSYYTKEFVQENVEFYVLLVSNKYLARNGILPFKNYSEAKGWSSYQYSKLVYPKCDSVGNSR